MPRMYKHITDEDLKDATEIAEVIKTLGPEEKAAVRIYIGALRDRMLLAQQTA